MSTYAYLALRCDAPGCHAETSWPTPVATHAELRRKRAHLDGWRTRRNPAGGPLLDLCPDHAAPATEENR